MVKVNKLICVVALVVILPVSAEDKDMKGSVDTVLDKFDPVLDYEIGGRRGGFGSRRVRPTIDVDYPEFGWNVGASCSGWDAGISVSGLMNNAKSKFQRLQKDLVSSITGFITSYPMLYIQREDPGLYEMLNNSILNGEDIFDVSATSCRDMSKRYMEGSNGIGDVVEASAWFDFSKNENNGKDNKDLIAEVESADENKGDSGVVGMKGEMCGGKDSARCKPVKDVIKEGFSRTTEYAGSDERGVPVISWIKQIWSDEEEAEKWIIDVVGDIHYATCQDCKKLIDIPGYGVYSFIADEATEIRDALITIVEGEELPTLNQLREISSNDVLINESVIYALRDERVQRQGFINRVSQDIALLRTVDMLLAARRLMISGKGDSNFASVPKNIEIINEKIKLLAEEVEMIKEELELKRIARGDSVAILLSRFESRRALRQNDGFDNEIQRRAVDGLKKVTGRR